MPAIDLARLKKQVIRLADLFDQPQAFLHELHDVLDFYVNRTLRSRRPVAPASVLETYHTPALVLRHIENELAPLARANPNQALELADTLWQARYLETCLLAAFLIGCIPPREDRLLVRLTAWSQQIRDPNVRAVLLTTSLSRLRAEAPDRLLGLIREWMHPARPRFWSNGIQALLPLLEETKYENLPPIFEIVTPVIESSPAILQEDLKQLIQALYRASPIETTYFIKNLLKESGNPQMKVTLRRILPDLPPEFQDQIRDLVRQPRLI
jgi:hypothetical protein